MKTFICVGDEVESLNSLFFGSRKVTALDGDHAEVEGFSGQIEVDGLIFTSLTPEHVARFLLSRPNEDIPSVIADMQRNQAVMKPRLIAYLRQIVGSERYMSAIISQVPARSYCWNDTAKIAEQVLDHLVEAVAST